MIFRKWSLRHGPGSIGEVSKTMAECYRLFKDKYPQASHEDLLLKTLQSRVDAWEKLGMRSLTKEEQEFWIKIPLCKLSTLILLVLRHENPRVPRQVWRSRRVWKIIDEMVDKYAPED